MGDSGDDADELRGLRVRVDELEQLPWDQLVPYEREQGGYWLYAKGCDIYVDGKVFVPVAAPATSWTDRI